MIKNGQELITKYIYFSFRLTAKISRCILIHVWLI